MIDYQKYPRKLLVEEEFIRDFEEQIGIRFINKTDCANKLMEHDMQIRAEAIDEFVKMVKEHHYMLSDKINSTDKGMFTIGIEQIAEQLKEQND